MIIINISLLKAILVSAMITIVNANNQFNYIYNGPPIDQLPSIPGINFTLPLKNSSATTVPMSVIPLSSPKPVTTNTNTKVQRITTTPPPTPFGHNFVITNRLGEEISGKKLDIFNRIAIGSQAFALELFSKFSDSITPLERDFMISPFSVWALLLLIAEGAVGDSLTQLQKTLRVSDDTYILRQAYKYIQNTLKVNTTTIEVSVLQALFTDVNQPISRDFEYVMEQSYEADVIPVNFLKPNLAAEVINNEVRQATHDLIKFVVQPSDLSDTQMILLSTLYFRGQWKMPFNQSLTEKKPFYREDGKVLKEVDMMFKLANFNYASMPDLQGHVLELPYGKENRLSMLLILPKKGVPVNQITKNLQSIGIAKIFQKLANTSTGYEDEEVEVLLPKFVTSSSFVVNEILYNMGIQDIFDPNYANLTNISPRVFVSKLFHNTKIVVNEEGTVAAAVTAAEFANKSQPPKFNFDRPFIYLIIDKKTNSLLFCGQVMNPVYE